MLPATARAQDVPDAPAPTDTVLPRTGVDPGVSDLREHLLDSFGDAPPPPHGVSPPNLQVSGQLGVSEEYTDNAGAIAGGGASGAGSDFITMIQPRLDVVETSQRVQASIDYAPIAQIYAENSSFSQFEEQGNGDVLLTALPGWLYLDARGQISQQAVFGGVGPGSTATLSPDERETVSSISVSPYVTRAFGGAGTLQAGVGYSYTATDAPNLLGGRDAILADPLLQDGGTFGSSNLSTDRAYANFTTGEDLARVRDKVGFDSSFYSGSGALAGGRRVLGTDDVSYALTRLVTLLGEAGFEDLDYPRSAYKYVGAIGSGGTELTFARGSTLTLEYRYTDGFGSFFAQGSVQASPRIRVFGGYSEGISTFDQDQQNTLLSGSTDATGAAASALLAAPLLATSNFFGANQNLSRLARLSVTASYLGDYDTVTLSVQSETTTPVGRQVGELAQISTSGIFGNVSERHQITDTLDLTGFLQYGSSRTGLVANTSGDEVSVSVGVEKSFPRQISTYLRFGGNYYVGGSAAAASGLRGQVGNESSVVIGAVKRF